VTQWLPPGYIVPDTFLRRVTTGLMPFPDPDAVGEDIPPLHARPPERRHSHAELRAMPHADYLRTIHWRVIRRQAIYRAGFICQHCRTQSDHLQGHHVTYERLGNEWPDDVVAICSTCHAALHGITDPTP